MSPLHFIFWNRCNDNKRPGWRQVTLHSGCQFATTSYKRSLACWNHRIWSIRYCMHYGWINRLVLYLRSTMFTPIQVSCSLANGWGVVAGMLCPLIRRTIACLLLAIHSRADASSQFRRLSLPREILARDSYRRLRPQRAPSWHKLRDFWLWLGPLHLEYKISTWTHTCSACCPIVSILETGPKVV